jgi:hypothetical protein
MLSEFLARRSRRFAMPASRIDRFVLAKRLVRLDQFRILIA